MARTKDVLTTGEVARICKVAPRTVSKWFDTGQLRGYRIPGSKDRRIPVAQLVRFMQDHGIPLNGLAAGLTRVLVVDDQAELVKLLDKALGDAHYEVRTAAHPFEAGVAAEQFHPQVMVLSAELNGVGLRDWVRSIRSVPDLGGVRLVATTAGGRDDRERTLREYGFDAVVQKPFEVGELVKVIEAALAGAAAIEEV